VLTRTWYAIRRVGISVPFPIRDVTVRQLSEDHELRLRQNIDDEIYAQLRPLPVFVTLSDEQIQQLAVRAGLHLYAADEFLVRQGDVGDSLFVIKSGLVRVDVRGRSGPITTVAHIRPPDFFGEMSLLTGERRSASVIAEADTEVVVVDKAALAEVLVGDLASLEALSQAVEIRLRESAEKVAAAEQIKPQQEVIQSGTLLARIQGFLGIR
jgi:CRP-like cAMP-binding protein